MCPTCGKRYLRPETLRDHMRVHTGERPFKCNYCHLEFTTGIFFRAPDKEQIFISLNRAPDKRQQINFNLLYLRYFFTKPYV